MKKRSLNEKLKNFLFAAALVALSSLLQNTLPVFPEIMGARVYLIIPFVVCTAMYKGEIYGAVLGIFAGSLWDAVSFLPDGSIALLLGAAGYICAVLSKKYMRRVLRNSLLFSFSASMIFVFFVLAYLSFTSSFEALLSSFTSYYLPSVLYTLIAAVPVHYIYRFLFAARSKDGMILNS